MKMNVGLRWFVMLAALLVVFAAESARADKGDPKVPFSRYKLPNGLEVILHQDRRVPLVAVNVWYHVGSGNETPGKSGFAHLFEHMMFQGSINTGSDVHFDTLRNIGASGVNGTTSEDRTNYFEVVPTHQLEVALWLEADRMGYMLPMLNAESFANQQEVVRNERRQRVDNVPYGKSRLAMSAALYSEGHPYRHGVIGLHEDLAGASLKDVIRFYKKWYVPANATLVLAGDFEIDQAKDLVNKWFGSFPLSEKPKPRLVAATRLTETKRIEVSDGFAKLRQVHYAWHTPALYAEGDAEMDILASALGRTGTGRLYKILVHEKQWAQRVAVYQASKGFSSTFNVSVTLKPDADMAAVEKVIDAELATLASQGVSERELKRAVVSVESSFVWRLEGLMARANLLQGYNHHTGSPDGITRDLDRYRKLTVDRVRSATVTYITNQKRVELITIPARQGGK